MGLDDPTEAQKEEFMSEIEQMKLLGSHPNIVSMVGCCTREEQKFLVIEYVPFGDLLKWLRRRRKMVTKMKKIISLISKIPLSTGLNEAKLARELNASPLNSTSKSNVQFNYLSRPKYVSDSAHVKRDV